MKVNHSQARRRTYLGRQGKSIHYLLALQAQDDANTLLAEADHILYFMFHLPHDSPQTLFQARLELIGYHLEFMVRGKETHG